MGKHADALRELDEKIKSLQAVRWEYVGRASQERDEELLAAKVEDWTKIREIFPFGRPDRPPVHACATWWRLEGAYLRCFIAAGPNHNIWAVWEVTDYRSERSFNRIHGTCPVEVELEIKRQYRARTGR